MVKTIEYSTDTRGALKRLNNALTRLGGEDLNYGHTSGMNDSSAFIEFRYKGEKHRFEYSRSKAEYYGLRIPNQKDILVLLVNGIVDLTRVAERGVFDFGRLIKDYKALEFVEIPQWAGFMGFNTRPRNMMEVESRFRELVKGSMNPNTNREDFENLQKAYEMARQYFGVKS